jgi:acyl carrier protein
MTSEEIGEVLQTWVVEKTGAAIDPRLRYAEHEQLDSFDVLELVVFSETTFGLKFTAADFANPEFATLSGLARLIRSRT